MSKIGPAAAPAVTKLLADENSRQLAAMILGEMGAGAKPAVDELIKAIDDKNEDIKRDVIVALAMIGPDASKASTKLMALLEDPDASARPAAERRRRSSVTWRTASSGVCPVPIQPSPRRAARRSAAGERPPT